MVREGFKQTEIGEIPEDWAVVPLSELVHNVEYGSAAKSNPRGKVAVLRMGNLQNGYINWEDLVFTDDEPEISKYTLVKDDVLFNRTNTVDLVGKTAIYRGEYPAIFAGYLIRINFKPKELNPSYLNYILNTNFSKNYSKKVLSVAVGQANINGQKLKTYPIPIPPYKNEQDVIAKALSDTDYLIASLEKLVAKKRDIKTATMQQLLTGKKRLPGFGEGKGYKQTELGEIPEDWDIKPLGILLKIRHGKSQKEVIDPNGQYPILATGGEIGRTNTPLYSKPSVLIGRKGTIDIPHFMDTPFWTVDTLFYSEIAPCADAKFLYYKFLFIDWYQYNEASGVPSLNAATIEKIVQAVPSEKDEQTAISKVLTDFDDEIASLEARFNKTKSIKQGMMQELLTGRTRLVDVNATQIHEEERMHGT